MTQILIQLNGEPYYCNTETTMIALLKNLELSPSTHKIAVECNQTLLPKSDYETYIIRPNDIIEILHFVGGG